LVQVHLVRWGGRVGWLLCGGNNSLCILAHPQDPDLRTPRDAHLPNGWGVPILFLNRRDIDVFEPERVMDDPAMRRRIRETYQASMSEILRNYPRDDPYLGFEWSAIFTPIEWNVWSDIRHLGLPMYPQFPVGPYFLDFADPVKKLGIEVDSRRYHEDREKDRLREQHLELQGWTIIRITGRQTYKEPDEVELDDAETLPVEDTNDQWNWAILDSSTAMLRFVQRYYYADRR
jgi:very-short-patch-repair endonuclease